MRQVLFSRWAGNTEFAAEGIVALPVYGVLGSSSRFVQSSGSNGFMEWPVSADGTFDNITLNLRASPTECGVLTFLWTLYHNGLPTDVIIEMSGDQTSGSYNGAGVTVEAGNTLRWVVAVDPPFPDIITMDLPDIIQTAEFVSSEAGVSIYFSRGVSIHPNSGTAGYNGVFNPNDAWVNNANVVRSVISLKGALTRYDFLMEASPVAAGGTSATSVLVLDGVEQDGTGGTVDTTQTLTNEAHGIWIGSLPLDPDLHQTIYMKATTVGFPAGGTTRTSLCFKFVAERDGLYWLGGYNGIPPSALAVEYQVATANDVDHQWESAFDRKELVGAITPVPLSGLRVWLAVAPGVGKSRTFEIADGPIVVLSGTETFKTGTGSTTITAGDLWVLKHTPTGTPSGITDGIAWAFVAGAPGVIGPLVWWHFQYREVTA